MSFISRGTLFHTHTARYFTPARIREKTKLCELTCEFIFTTIHQTSYFTSHAQSIPPCEVKYLFHTRFFLYGNFTSHGGIHYALNQNDYREFASVKSKTKLSQNDYRDHRRSKDVMKTFIQQDNRKLINNRMMMRSDAHRNVHGYLCSADTMAESSKNAHSRPRLHSRGGSDAPAYSIYYKLLSGHLTRSQVYSHFGQFGDIIRIKTFADRQYCFVTFTNYCDAIAAIENSNKYTIHGCNINLSAVGQVRKNQFLSGDQQSNIIINSDIPDKSVLKHKLRKCVLIDPNEITFPRINNIDILTNGVVSNLKIYYGISSRLREPNILKNPIYKKIACIKPFMELNVLDTDKKQNVISKCNLRNQTIGNNSNIVISPKINDKQFMNENSILNYSNNNNKLVNVNTICDNSKCDSADLSSIDYACSKFQFKEKYVTLLNINVQGIRDATHFDHLILNVNKINPDFIAIQETWLRSYHSNKSVEILNYNIFRCDRKCSKHDRDKGGGVAIYIKNSYKSKKISCLYSNSIGKLLSGIEFLMTEVQNKFSKLLICNVYKVKNVLMMISKYY